MDRSGGLIVTTPERSRPRRPTGTEILHKRKVNELAANQITRIRRVAEQWRNGAALATLAGAAISAFTGPDVVGAASDLQRIQGGCALAVALVLAVVAIGLSMRASFGWPKVVDLRTPEALAEWERKEIHGSIKALTASIWLTLLSVLAFGIAGAVLVFGFVIKF
jgi:hypothetical protein